MSWCINQYYALLIQKRFPIDCISCVRKDVFGRLRSARWGRFAASWAGSERFAEDPDVERLAVGGDLSVGHDSQSHARGQPRDRRRAVRHRTRPNPRAYVQYLEVFDYNNFI